MSPRERRSEGLLVKRAAQRPSPRVRVRRSPNRAAYDRATIDAILDEALVCHLGFVHNNQPFVIPTLHARLGDRLYVHGSSATRMLGTRAGGRWPTTQRAGAEGDLGAVSAARRRLHKSPKRVAAGRRGRLCARRL